MDNRYRKVAERIVNRYVSAAMFWAWDEDDDRPNDVKEAETRERIISTVAEMIEQEVLAAGDAEFTQMQNEVKQRIKQGARRTSGRIAK